MAGVVDNTAEARFELEEQGLLAFADYRRDGDRLVVTHVESDPALRGSGTAGRLMEGVVRAAEAEGLRIVPLCGYAAAWLRRRSGRAS